MNLKELAEGLKNNSITVIDNGHKVHGDFMEKIENYIKMYKEFDLFNNQIIIGVPLLFIEYICRNCENDLCLILLDINTLTIIETSKYSKLKNNFSKIENVNKKDFRLTIDMLTQCPAIEFFNIKKLTSEINIKTGNLIFDNYFENEELYSFPKEINQSYSEYSICNIIGRNSLMQQLSSKNVGYGQMGNTSISIWSNKTEVLVTGYDIDEESEILESLEYDLKNCTTDIKIDIIKSIKEQIKFIKDNFEYKGEISLSVWRWQCADKSVLDSYNETISKSAISVKVKPGKYLIEHYYDFMRRDDTNLIFSKLKLINNN